MNEDEQYIKGFNSGYNMHQTDGQLAETIVKGMTTSNDMYASGVKDGIVQSRKEKEKSLEALLDKQRQIQKNKKSRGLDKDSGKSIERDL